MSLNFYQGTTTTHTTLQVSQSIVSRGRLVRKVGETKEQNIVLFKEQNNGARSDVEHGSHVTLTVHKQDQDGVRFCGGFRHAD